MYLRHQLIILLLAVSVLLMGADSADNESNERARLLEQQAQLNARIEALRRDQDFLLFQKSLYGVDSKYLVLNMTTKKGQLKYKNRILMDFPFTTEGSGKLTPGALSLTEKTEAVGGKSYLVFNNALVLSGKRLQASPSRARITMKKNIFLSVFYALETGAKAYILR